MFYSYCIFKFAKIQPDNIPGKSDHKHEITNVWNRVLDVTVGSSVQDFTTVTFQSVL